ncbi:MAG TPA: hypothetical protein VGU22_08410 [Methylomirabilota bacterium]|jgi:hypothetical protein|nr:hypothetical protein [Methylomirabilota bacterium]
MLKTLMVLAVAVSLALSSGVAFASSCPKVIKEGRDAAAKMKADDPKVKQATAKLDQAQKLHDAGKHADSLKTANDALALLGVKKDK